VRLTGSKNVRHFRLKCSKLRRFLGLRPRLRWGAYDALPDPLVVRGFLPSAIAVSRLRRLIPISPPNKNTQPISPPKHKILEPPLPCTAKKKSCETRVECVRKNPGEQRYSLITVCEEGTGNHVTHLIPRWRKSQ